MSASRFFASVMVASTLLSSPLLAADLVTRESAHGVSETMDRLETLLAENGIGVMARIDHRANAQKVGLELGPSQLLLFGNPAQGTLLMQENPVVGIDLPMKALAWEDEDGGVWLSHVAPSSIASERGITGPGDTIAMMDRGLGKLIAAAAAP